MFISGTLSTNIDQPKQTDKISKRLGDNSGVVYYHCMQDHLTSKINQRNSTTNSTMHNSVTHTKNHSPERFNKLPHI